MSTGNKIGRIIGAAGAYAVEGAVRGANGLGSFGRDVVAGTEAGFEEKHAELLLDRQRRQAEMVAKRAALVTQHKAAMVVVATPMAAKRTTKA